MIEPFSARDILILTATRRLARRLLFNDSEQQESNGKKVWDTPQIFDLRSWLETQWMESWPDHFFLSKLQSLHIWKNIIANDRECLQSREQEGIRKQWTLLHPRGAAKRAAEAYGLIKEYKLEIVPDPLALTHESQLFLRWLKLYKKHMDEIKLIILDLTMPKLNGEETYKRLIKFDPKVKVILSSGFNAQDAIKRFSSNGIAGYLQKPYHLQSLREKIKEVLA
ncbi:MAG: response regulator [Nitrospinae bacterium]|nr:response regulator [Nitrospinota bacterium]